MVDLNDLQKNKEHSCEAPPKFGTPHEKTSKSPWFKGRTIFVLNREFHESMMKKIRPASKIQSNRATPKQRLNESGQVV
jgi:hypothetical protein